MMHKTSIITVFLLLSGAACFGQTSYKGLAPGKSTRAEVERVLGQPVNRVSETLVEYRAQPLTNQIFVQYGRDSAVGRRIELFCRMENSTCADLLNSLDLRLPLSDAEKIRRQDGKWLAYYGAPLFIITTGEMTGPTPARVGFYSRDLYESAVAKVEDAREAVLAELAGLDGQPTSTSGGEEKAEPHQSSSAEVIGGASLKGKAISMPRPVYPAIARAKNLNGTVTVQIVVDESGRVISATAISGHPLLQQAAVDAARQARFSPTLSNGLPVRVSGTLEYDFALK
ncbi:MAG TPA: TonB family protein [Pyrinomonadaceae bacterium]